MSGLGDHQKILDPIRIFQPLKLATSKFVHKLGLGLPYQKTTFRAKTGGGLGQGSTQISWDPYLILQPLKLATSNLVHNLDLRLAYQKTTFWTKIGGGLGWGSVTSVTEGKPGYLILQCFRI